MQFEIIADYDNDGMPEHRYQAFEPATVLSTSPLLLWHKNSYADLPEWPVYQIGEQEWLIPYTLEADEGSDGGVMFSILGDVEDDSLLMHEMDYSGQSWLDIEQYPFEDSIAYALRLGVCPGQTFYLRVSYEFYGYADDAEYAWDCTLAWAEELTESTHANRWKELLDANARYDAICEDHKSAWEARVAAAPRYLDIVRVGMSFQLRLCTTAESPCACHNYPKIESYEACPGAGTVEWAVKTIQQKGWSAYPIRMTRNMLIYWVDSGPGAAFDPLHPVLFEDFLQPDDKAYVMPSLADTPRIFAAIDAQRRLSA